MDDLDDDDEYVTLDMVHEDIAQEKIAAIQVRCLAIFSCAVVVGQPRVPNPVHLVS